MNSFTHLNNKKTVLFIIALFSLLSIGYSQNKCCSKVNNLNIRSEADIKSNVIGKLNLGDCKSIISIEENWIDIEMENNGIGYVSKEFVNLELTSDISELKKNNSSTWIIIVSLLAVLYFFWRKIVTFIYEIYLEINSSFKKNTIETKNTQNNRNYYNELSQEELQRMADELTEEGYEWQSDSLVNKQPDNKTKKESNFNPAQNRTSYNSKTSPSEYNLSNEEKSKFNKQNSPINLNQENSIEKLNEKKYNDTPKINFYCEYCGTKASSIAILTKSSCAKHPNGINKGKHKLYEGSEKLKYYCKYCGMNASSISILTRSSCAKHPIGLNKGNHSPAL